jgi:glycosyltransferase involved in cell wall biosynthesis
VETWQFARDHPGFSASNVERTRRVTRADGAPRILRLITRLNVGGPARQALLLTRALADEYDVALLSGRATAEEGELQDPRVAVEYVPLVRPVRPAADVRALGILVRRLRHDRPAILHTHMAKAGTVGRVAARVSRCGSRTVHTFHGHVLEGYFSPRVERAFVRAEQMLARRTDVLVAVSPEIRDELVALGIGTAAQYEIIPVGLDLSAFLAVSAPAGALRRRLGLPDDAHLIGSVGRLVPIKDHLTLLDALRSVPDAHLAVIGDGELRPELEAEVGRLDLGDRVHFIGWSDDLAADVSDLDLVVLSSRNEGTPTALVEAAAAAKAVVATDVGGVRTVVRDGETGLLVPPADGAALAGAVRRLLGDEALRRRMGAAARPWVQDRFGEGRLVADIRALYSSMRSGAPRR